MLSRCVGVTLLEAVLAPASTFSNSNMSDAQTYKVATTLVVFNTES
jgi:hypothetical protein